MVEIANIESSPVVQITISDKITKEDMQNVDDFFENKVSEEAPVNVMLLMENWGGITVKSLLKDFKMMKHVKKMNKAAFVADSAFLKEDAKVEDLFPGITVKYFQKDEKEDAKKWLEE